MFMKKVLTGIALAGAVSSLSAAEIVSNDAAFLFGQQDVNVVAMSGAEMAQTEGQLLEILNPVIGIAGNLPVVGPVLDPVLGTVTNTVNNLPIVGSLLTTDAALPIDGLLSNLPIIGSLLGSTGGLLPTNTLLGNLPIVGGVL
jgi:hypothetical protein